MEAIQNLGLVDILTIAIIVLIVIFIVKKAVTLVVVGVIILGLFQVGFLYNGKDVGLTNLDKYIDSETFDSIVAFFDDFDARRKENAIVDAEAVYEDMEGLASDAVDGAVGLLTEENFNKLSDSISAALTEAGIENIPLEEIIKILAEEFETTVENPEVQQLGKDIYDKITESSGE